MASDGFGEAKPIGGQMEPSDPFASPAPTQQAAPSSAGPTAPPAYAPPAPPAYAPPAQSVPPAPASPPGVGASTPLPPLPPPSFRPAATADRNWMGIVSLILGLLGGGILGLAFGIAGVRAAGEGRATNKTMAIWGIVLNCTMWIVYVGMFGALGLFADSASPYGGGGLGGGTKVISLTAPQCFQEPSSAGDAVYNAKVVSCDQPHYGQVYHTGILQPADYVGYNDIGDAALDLCFADQAIAHVEEEASWNLYINVYFPDDTGWQLGERNYVCFVTDDGRPLTEDYYVLSTIGN